MVIPSTAVFLLAASALAPAAGGVGIDEKLGAKVPAGVVLNDEEGKPVSLGSLLGKPTILTLNYFSCAGICTPLLNGVVEALNGIPLEPGKDFQVITVSFDPSDGPEIAFQKRTNYLKQMTRPFPPGAWRFLTGSAEATRQVCDAVGFRFQEEELELAPGKKAKSFLHPGAIMILGPDGAVTRYMYGTVFLPADVEMAIGEAARGQARPTIARILTFCFGDKPGGRGFVMAVTRVAALGTIVLAAVFVTFAVRRRARHAREENP
jgi:protein SCO1